MNALTFYLQITSFSLAGGIHFYGDLKFYDTGGEYRLEELKHTISAKEAAQRNKVDLMGRWRPGDTSRAFDTQEEVVEAAKKRAKEVAGGGPHFLFRGQFAMVGPPDEILAAPEGALEILEPIRAAYHRLREESGWGVYPAGAVELEDEWVAALKKAAAA